jgi:glutaredoxin
MNIHDAANRKRLEQISKHFALEAKTPALYGCGRAFVALRDETHARQSLDQLRTLTMYGRAGCPRCAAAKELLKSYGKQFPGLIIKTHDIVADSAANTELQSLLAAHRTTAASVPVFHLCDQVVVGFLDPASGKARLDGVLEKWSLPCKKKKEDTTPQPSKSTRNEAPAILTPGSSVLVGGFLYLEPNPQAPGESPDRDEDQEVDQASQAPLPLPEDPLAPLPEGKEAEASGSDEIDLPFVGSVRLSSLGLPLFTIAVGLVDGFNPCAMWVLVFLLSVLVNLHNRWKILAVAGTFVFVSGAFYFAFMAAWISVFQFIGMLRGVQITLGVLAVLVGIVHIKDFFAFKKGFSLSIPESAKPGIYARVRRIVTAESLVGAILGAAVLAALVNMVELLCTAGLPALYTQILFSQELATWKNYSYLLLYNLAYMFDDGLMVAVVVITLGHGKMQETHGRWLKLISGLAVVALGMLMLFKPTWLGM